MTTTALLWALIVAGVDLRSRCIPNGLLLAAAVPGVAVFFFHDHGWLDQSLRVSAIGMLVPLLLLPGFLLKQLGGGDVKFAACCGWFLGAALQGQSCRGLDLSASAQGSRGAGTARGSESQPRANPATMLVRHGVEQDVWAGAARGARRGHRTPLKPVPRGQSE